jgi:xanthine/CO dehydrogenase XdhC/CoxF family maturation factor
LIFSQFIEDGVATEEQLARVACPVGVDIDSRSVPEIAVSIMAQYIQKRAAASRDWEEAVLRRVGQRGVVPA